MHLAVAHRGQGLFWGGIGFWCEVWVDLSGTGSLRLEGGNVSLEKRCLMFKESNSLRCTCGFLITSKDKRGLA